MLLVFLVICIMHGKTLLMGEKHALNFEICKALQGQLSHAFFLQLSCSLRTTNEAKLRRDFTQIFRDSKLPLADPES